jgi:hypothetical protein
MAAMPQFVAKVKTIVTHWRSFATQPHVNWRCSEAMASMFGWSLARCVAPAAVRPA